MIDAAKLKELAEKATKAPWYTVEKPWRPDGVGTWVVAGNEDPQAGTPVLDSIEIDTWPSDSEPDYSQSDRDLALVCELRNSLPAILALVEREGELTKQIDRWRAMCHESDFVGSVHQQECNAWRIGYLKQDFTKALELCNRNLDYALTVAAYKAEARAAMGGEGA